ncbi:hypothetical protein [Streptomyces sp. NPDC059479]|uniref:ATP-dependent DNA ligase n=1 Tax=Streptomyces sp. NPDC059479 TaxID=3346848 RepID=UPI003675CE26
MTAAFPEITAAAGSLPADVGLDGEVVVWANDRLAFERLQGRLNRTAARAARLAARWPAHFVVFDLLHFWGRGRPGGSALCRATCCAGFAVLRV